MTEVSSIEQESPIRYDLVDINTILKTLPHRYPFLLIDRGSLRDTVIGEGTKIDNLVQIGHNVTIGRHCLIAAKCGLAGSLTLGDHVALGAMVGLNNHITIGDGAQVTAMSGVKDSIPAKGRWGGFFAKPTKQWFREILAVEKLGRDSAPGANTNSQDAKDERE